MAQRKNIVQIVYGNIFVKEWETNSYDDVCSKMYSLLYDLDGDLMFVYEAYTGASFTDD